MADNAPLVLHPRTCGNPHCRVQFWICNQCDRRQRYCGLPCRRQARAIGHRQANHRYQRSARGRRNHSLRQSRYRHRLRKNKVTDQGSPTCPAAGMLDSWTHGALPTTASDSMAAIDCPRCLRCRRPGSVVRPTDSLHNPQRGDTMISPASHAAPTKDAGMISREQYVATVLGMYLALPDTPPRASERDRQLAQHLFTQGLAVETVETALLLASLRRLLRPSDVAPLPAIRSLAYFQPVMDELVRQPPPTGYLRYLRRTLDRQHKRVAGRQAPPRL